MQSVMQQDDQEGSAMSKKGPSVGGETENGRDSRLELENQKISQCLERCLLRERDEVSGKGESK
jgi:hypothetical protein